MTGTNHHLVQPTAEGPTSSTSYSFKWGQLRFLLFILRQSASLEYAHVPAVSRWMWAETGTANKCASPNVQEGGLTADMLRDQLPVRRDFSQVNFVWAGCMKEEAKDERKVWLISKNIEFSVYVDEFTLRDVSLCSESSDRGSLEEDVMWSRKQPDWILIRKRRGGVMQSGEGLH